MLNIVTKYHDFNKPVRFSRDGFSLFVDERCLVLFDVVHNVDFLKDVCGNIYAFRRFENASPESVYAQLVPAESTIVKNYPV